jgi:molecular chaperone Hsp33
MASPIAIPDDRIIPFQIEASRLRGRLVRMGPLVAEVLRHHSYPPLVASRLAEALALTAALAAALKYDGIFTLQIKGDGPVRLLVADATSAGAMRGYAQFDAGAVAALAETEADPSVPRLFGGGYLAFTVDQGPDTERYQGIVELSGATLIDCVQRYLRQSEQIDAAIQVAARREGSNGSTRWHAGAIMMQRLPPRLRDAGHPPADDEEIEENWRRVCILLGSVTDRELLADDLAPERLLLRLFHNDSVRVFGSRPLVHRCRCSRERVERTLAAIPREELESLKVDGRVEVVCQFCNTAYLFDDADLDALHAS